MPIYEYICTACGHEFERLRPIRRMDDEAPCPECDAESRRELSVFCAYSTTSDGGMRSVAGGGCSGCPPGGGCSLGA